MPHLTIPAGPIAPIPASAYLAAAKSDLVARAWYTESESAQSLTMHAGRHGGGNLAIGREDVAKVIQSDGQDEQESWIRVFDRVTVSVVGGEVSYDLHIAGHYWRATLGKQLFALAMLVAVAFVSDEALMQWMFAVLPVALIGLMVVVRGKQSRKIGRDLVDSIHASAIGALSVSDQSS